MTRAGKALEPHFHQFTKCTSITAATLLTSSGPRHVIFAYGAMGHFRGHTGQQHLRGPLGALTSGSDLGLSTQEEISLQGN